MLNLATTYPNISALITVLVQAGVPAHESWWLLEKLFQQSRAALLSAGELTLSAAQLVQLQHWLEQLIVAQQPLQYLLGTVPFLNLELLVAPPTLIPRPETEAWCARLITELPTTPQQILDFCTGTGCIGLAVAQARPASQVQAVDIAPAACALAEQNRQRLQLTNFTVHRSD
ncbi:MAG TPA: methyltransferase, partial [Candidatus Babeliales bacterium]|nr:methyltransferase [Candidatus Babeliales bacterium]